MLLSFKGESAIISESAAITIQVIGLDKISCMIHWYVHLYSIGKYFQFLLYHPVE